MSEIQKKESAILIYPNPVSEDATIFVQLNTIVNAPVYLTVYNETGQMILTRKNIQSFFNNKEAKIPLNVSELNSGIYFIQISTTENSYSRKLIIQH